MSSLQDCFFNGQKLCQCHQILSSKIVIKNCHQKLPSCLLITLIKCLKGHKSLGSLCIVVKTLIVSGNRQRDQGTKGQGHLLSCSGQLKTEIIKNTSIPIEYMLHGYFFSHQTTTATYLPQQFATVLQGIWNDFYIST